MRRKAMVESKDTHIAVGRSRSPRRGHGAKSDDTRAKVLLELVSGKTQPAAARAAGIGVRTLRDWLVEPDFQQALEEARRTAFDDGLQRIKGLMVQAVDTFTEEHITQGAIAASATNLVPAESILVVVKSKVLMHRLPVAIAKVPLCHGQDIKSIQCSALQPEFARFMLTYHEKRLLNLARGANTEGLTLPMLEELPIPIVPAAEQEAFGEIVRTHEHLRVVQREAVRQADHLFGALLHRAFSG